ncbi:hypothetical protein IWW38_002885, partial [Coemansia aciculifera]
MSRRQSVSSSSFSLGISTTTAKQRLLELIDTDRGRIVVPFHIEWRALPLLVLLGASMTVGLLLIADGSYTLAQNHSLRKQGIASLVEGILVLLSLVVTLWVLRREARLEAAELDRRLQAVAGEIRGWTGMYGDLRTPQLPTVTTFMTMRDGRWRDVPTLLLVEGDVVALGYGETAPCKVEEKERVDGRVRCIVRDTPLKEHLAQIASHHQRTARSVLQNQICVVGRLCVLRILPALAVVALIANAVIYGAYSRRRGHSAMEVVVGRTLYVVLPFASTVLWAVLWVWIRILGNASVVVLFDTLQRSKTEYEDMADIDEFDVEALPPTKDIAVGIGAVVSRMRWLWANCDFRNLSRSSNLCETLGNITVICSIDREGTIAEPFCTAEQMVVPSLKDDYAVLDLAEQRVVSGDMQMFIVDDGWEAHLPALRPLGLACGLNTRCRSRVNKQHRADAAHKRHNAMGQRGKIMAAQDT